MDDKTILITGAASGIGRATARLFVKKGWFVGMVDINRDALDGLRAELGEDNALYSVMDVSDIASVREAIGQFSKRTNGRMDVLFNNAGILEVGFFNEISLEAQQRVVDVNLKGMINCSYTSLPLLQQSAGSRIISMSSASVIYGTAHLAVYSATKSAVSSLTEALNLELEEKGIHVCDIRVPFVKTPMLDTEIKMASLEKMGAQLVPEDVAKLVWKACHRKKVHHNGKGMLPNLFLAWIAPAFLKRMVSKYIMLPAENK